MSSKNNWRARVAKEMSAHIAAGTAPWQKHRGPGQIPATPHNPATGKAWSGINALWLETQGHDDPRWLTAGQAVARGAVVRGGENACQVEYWKWSEKGERLDRPAVFYASVFNAEQIDGLEPYQAPERSGGISEAEELLADSGVTRQHVLDTGAWYNRDSDEIRLPVSRDAFDDSSNEYYATAMHELAHATGHQSRLARDSAPRGTEAFARETLRASMAGYMVSRELGLGNYPARHASHGENWRKAIDGDRSVLFQTARDAGQIATWIQQPALRPALEQQAQTSRKGAKATMKQEPDRQAAAGKTAAPDRRVYIAVPFTEKNQAKAEGARWDRKQKSWFVPEGADRAAFDKWLPENQPKPADKKHDPVAEFAGELKAAGVSLKDTPVMDGKWHRASLSEDLENGEKNASYRAFLDGLPNGQIQNFRSGEMTRWVSHGEPLSEERRATLKAEAAGRQETRAAERQATHDKVAMRSQEILDGAGTPYEEWPALTKEDRQAMSEDAVIEHEDRRADDMKRNYLLRKDVGAYGIRENGAERELVVPMRDVDGKLWSLQSIDEGQSGEKRFMTGGRKAGLMHVIDPEGRLSEPKAEVFIAEGYATAASVHEATGRPAIVAFDAGNLKPVAEAIHQKYPEASIVIAADNDHRLENNVGLVKGEEAARAVGGKIIAPVLGDEDKVARLSDWNDVVRSRGRDAVAREISEQLKQAKAVTKSAAKKPATRAAGRGEAAMGM